MSLVFFCYFVLYPLWYCPVLCWDKVVAPPSELASVASFRFCEWVHCLSTVKLSAHLMPFDGDPPLMCLSCVVPSSYVVVVEHDLSVLDYLSDYICVLYGHPGAYGVVTTPFSVREGINIFLQGFVPTENLRFRDVELNFKV